MSPEFDTILTNKTWRYVILCVFCRLPPGRLQKGRIPESEVESYCYDDHSDELYDLIGVRLVWGNIDVYPTDVFVAVKK